MSTEIDKDKAIIGVQLGLMVCALAYLLPVPRPEPVAVPAPEPVAVPAPEPVAVPAPEPVAVPAPPSPPEDPRLLTLFRVCAHEGMFFSRPDFSRPDCYGFHSVLESRARALRVDYPEAARRYARCAVTSEGCDPRRHWTTGLDTTCARPEHYPGPGPLEGAPLDRCRALVALARSVLSGEAAGCTEPPDHWGSLGADTPDVSRAARAIAAGLWSRVRCPKALNGFYRVHRR